MCFALRWRAKGLSARVPRRWQASDSGMPEKLRALLRCSARSRPNLQRRTRQPSPVTRMLSNASAAARLTRPATHDLLCEQKFLGGQSARRTRAAQSEGADSEKWPHQWAPMITAVETAHGTPPGASSRAAERAERAERARAEMAREPSKIVSEARAVPERRLLAHSNSRRRLS